MHPYLSFSKALILTCDSLPNGKSIPNHRRSLNQIFVFCICLFSCTCICIYWNAVGEVVRCVCGRPDWNWGQDGDVAPPLLRLSTCCICISSLCICISDPCILCGFPSAAPFNPGHPSFWVFVFVFVLVYVFIFVASPSCFCFRVSDLCIHISKACVSISM